MGVVVLEEQQQSKQQQQRQQQTWLMQGHGVEVGMVAVSLVHVQ
jgi:hypothetical protein